MDHDWDAEDTTPDMLSKQCLAQVARLRVAVVGGGLGGLMAARTLARLGAKVTVYEARAQVGGRVLSDSTFAKGRITEIGAELVGSIHTRWCDLAKEYGISLISRMDADLYRGQQLEERVILDRVLTAKEIADIKGQEVHPVLERIAQFAEKTIPAGRESQPWKEKGLLGLDHTSVAHALETQFQVVRNSEQWRALELLLVNDNVAQLDQMNFLSLLCLVRGGQTERRAGKPVTIEPNPLMGYWNELEIYRCGDGCQRLALAIADEVHHMKGCRVVTHTGVRHIDLRPPGDGVVVTAQSTREGTFHDWLREKIPVNPAKDIRHYDCVVFAIPPAVWGYVKVIPAHPGSIGLMGWGVAVKFFSNVKERFWIKDGFAPMGGSLEIGQVWEGTDNQTRVRGQDIVLSVYTGARAPSADDYKKGLDRLYPANPRKGSGYLANLNKKPKPIHADWSRQPFIQTGLTSPQLGQVFTTGQRLNEPFQGRLFFAGEHTQMDHFGYMEGAIRSGERAARLLIDNLCGQLEKPPPEPALVAAAEFPRGIARAS
jgi:monoamine oxidase